MAEPCELEGQNCQSRASGLFPFQGKTTRTSASLVQRLGSDWSSTRFPSAGIAGATCRLPHHWDTRARLATRIVAQQGGFECGVLPLIHVHGPNSWRVGLLGSLGVGPPKALNDKCGAMDSQARQAIEAIIARSDAVLWQAALACGTDRHRDATGPATLKGPICRGNPALRTYTRLRRTQPTGRRVSIRCLLTRCNMTQCLDFTATDCRMRSSADYI
ncbi:hypothetical protein QBC47DRAFT_1017 [Echria macrotheca]|uniref:Uncharacterized protein n=1 Tax=Echria macrotheca TaxID=438768 RepID=A0AAJ0BN81_9PEZI|nr:hypothetical protein QBC47DRAFT_1017 [Echria macrotheca]